jgi:hypothetical protein
MENIINVLLETWKSIPTWVQALPLLFGGWLLATVLRLLVSGLLGLIGLDRAGERSGINEFLRKGMVNYMPSKLGGVMVFWIVLGGVFVKVAQMLDVGIVKVLSTRLGEVIPGIIVATLIGILGIVIVAFLGNFTSTLARNAGFPHANLVGRVIKWVGTILVCLIAFEQVSIGKTLLSPLVQILVGAVAFGTALAFGLGCKDLARDFALRLLAALRERNRAATKSDLEG